MNSGLLSASIIDKHLGDYFVYTISYEHNKDLKG